MCRKVVVGEFSDVLKSRAARPLFEAIAKVVRKQNLPLHRIVTVESLTAVASELRRQDVDGLYAAVGEGHVSAQHVVSRLIAAAGGEDGATEDLAEATLPGPVGRSRSSSNDPGVVVKGMEDLWVKLAKCCTPVPGDEIMGFITRGNGVSVHRVNCPNATSLKKESERLIEVEWAPSSSSVFLVQVQVEALDRAGLLSDVTRVLSENHVNILSASVNTTRDRVAMSRFVFEMGDPLFLEHVVNAVRRIDGAFLGHQVADMTVGGQDLEVLPEVFIDGLGLGGGLDDDELAGHVRLISRPHVQRIRRCFEVGLFWRRPYTELGTPFAPRVAGRRSA